MFRTSVSAVIENQSHALNLKRIECTAAAAAIHIAAVSPARTPVVASHRKADAATTASMGRKSRNNAAETMKIAGTDMYKTGASSEFTADST